MISPPFFEKTGELVHGEFTPASGTGGEITLYTRDGTARTLAATERLYIYFVYASTDTAATLTMHCDANDDNVADAGEVVLGLPVGFNGGFAVPVMFVSQLGAKPHILASASGTVGAGLQGFIATDD